MKKSILFLFLITVSSITAIAQSTFNGRVSISEVYYDTYIDEKNDNNTGGFGEFIELFNSSTEDMDISGWRITDNFNSYYFPQGTIIKSGDFKVIAFKMNSSLGTSDFVTLFPEAAGHESDILFQSTIRLANKWDIIKLINNINQLQHSIQYGNWYQCSSCNFITTGIDNSNTGLLGSAIQDINKQGFFQSSLNDYYGYEGSSASSGSYQKTTVHPFALQLNVPLLPLVPDVPVVTNENGNWIHSESFDFSGTRVAASRNYYNFLGKPKQSLNYDVKENKMWASETLYDSHGRAALQTLSAPVEVGYNFGLHENFMKDASGGDYTTADFDSGMYIEYPSQVSTNQTSSPLGWYYSSNNNNDLFQDITSYPFLRTVFSKLNPGKVDKVIGGNKTNGEWLQSYSFSMPAAQELHYAFGPGYFPRTNLAEETCVDSPGIIPSNYYVYELVPIDVADGCNMLYQNIISDVALYPFVYEPDYNDIYKILVNGTEGYYAIINIAQVENYNNISNNGLVSCGPYTSCSQLYNPADDIKITKTISRDIHGVETVVFVDSDGNTLAAARSGNEDNPSRKKYNVVSPIGAQGFVDIHIPVGCGGTVTFKGPSDALYNVYDLVSGSTTPISYPNPVSGSTYLYPGIYRVQEITSYHNNPLPYVKITGTSINLVDSANQVAVSYNVNYYDYSLNYYDKAGRLKESVQPEGFDDALTLATSTRNHQLTSSFEYNTLGQLQNTESPDEGSASFKYRTDGQIRFSQNSKQQAAGEFSYTNYDPYGRPVESGVFIEGTITFASADNLLDNVLEDITIDNDGLPNASCKEQIFTLYDKPDSSLEALLISNNLSVADYRQTYVAGNVSKTYTANPETNTTWYSYDVAGKLRFIVQDIPDLGLKTIDYGYDFATNQVTVVDYQRNNTNERFIHDYEYNVVGQLVRVKTSLDNVTFKEQAEYIYNEAGALVRTELAEDLQGIDYVYNINGQLKAINSPQSTGFVDPGNDSPSTNGFKPDVFGMILDYNDYDFIRSGNSIYNGLNNVNTNKQFNGNIGSIRWNNNTPTSSTNIDTYRYHYNKNNWLSGADYGTSTANSTVSFTQNSSNDYQVSNLTYDANGNIKTLSRNRDTENGNNSMDNFTYFYNTGKNQLNHVTDAVTVTTNADDLKNQGTNNYTYNSIGQLIKDDSEQVEYSYNASGLVISVSGIVTWDKPFPQIVNFFYNDRGQRARKEVVQAGDLHHKTVKTYYVRDATGNVMAIYEGVALKEHPIYGSNRIGVYMRSSNSSLYQLADHLGNVRAVILQDANNNTSVLSHTDYYPFGMPMPNRNVEGGYRYGYQGEYAEKDSETGLNAFQLRMYDSRIGRWISPDPYSQYSSPYLGMGNNPINGVDPDGGCFTTDNEGNTIPCPDMDVGSTMTGSSGLEWTMQEDGWALSDTDFAQYGVDLGTVDLSDIAYWRDINALAVNLNKQKDLETGKSASIRMLEELEKEAQMPQLIQMEIPVANYSSPFEYIGMGGISLLKFIKNPSRLKHIFRNAPGHVNPTTVTSQNRYLNLFNSVASDAKNLVETTNAAKISANVKTFHRTFRNGKQIWVETINGKIVNAGINNIPR